MEASLTTQQGCTKSSPQCTNWMKKVNGKRPTCCTEHMKELVFRADDLLTQQGIIHWIDFGTLLGAVRDQAIIPWDYDVDISLLVDDSTSFEFIEKLFRDAGYYVTRKPNIPCEIKIFYSLINHNHLDLYLYHRSDDGILRMNWAHNSENWSFPEHFLNTLERVILYDRQFWVPSPLDDFLSKYRYGPDYQIPIRFFNDVTFFFEPRDYTPAVAKLLQELEPLEIGNRKLKAQTQTQKTPKTVTISSKVLQRLQWLEDLHCFISADDRLAYLIRASYNMSAPRRAATLGRVWKYLHTSRIWEKIVKRKYNTQIPTEEITPAAYLLLSRIAQEKVCLQDFQKNSDT